MKIYRTFNFTFNSFLSTSTLYENIFNTENKISSTCFLKYFNYSLKYSLKCSKFNINFLFLCYHSSCNHIVLYAITLISSGYHPILSQPSPSALLSIVSSATQHTTFTPPIFIRLFTIYHLVLYHLSLMPHITLTLIDKQQTLHAIFRRKLPGNDLGA